MRLSVFRDNDRVLLVGEGNFSFAASLAEHNLPIAITASCYESPASSETARKNFDVLETHGIRVLLGVDGTKLEEHSVLGEETFDKIVFNFPHVGGKMRLDKNRELLQKFFASAGKLLKHDGTILMTLCNGQGGTCADYPRRRWDDSWKVTEMAAHADLILSSVEPFGASNFRDYTSTGYRGLDKEFNMQNSLTHFFKKAEAPCLQNMAPLKKIDKTSSIKNNDKQTRYRDMFPPESFKSLDNLCPPVFTFDVTFSVFPDFRKSDLYAVLHNFAGRIVRDVEFVGTYEFPDGEKITETYRIIYQSDDLPLYRERTIQIHTKVIAKLLEENLRVVVTR